MEKKSTKTNKKTTKSATKKAATKKPAAKKATKKVEPKKVVVKEEVVTKPKTVSVQPEEIKEEINQNTQIDEVIHEEHSHHHHHEEHTHEHHEHKSNTVCLPCRKIAIIASLVALAALLIFGFIKLGNSEKKYQLSNVLGCFEGSSETITLPSNYYLGSDANFYLENEDGLLELVGGMSCFTGTEDDYNALVEETKPYYDDNDEYEINGFKAFRITYDYNDAQYQILFMFKDTKMLQLTFTNLNTEEVKKISESIK